MYEKAYKTGVVYYIRTMLKQFSLIARFSFNPHYILNVVTECEMEIGEKYFQMFDNLDVNVFITFTKTPTP
jgi:hypothetical protein